MSNSLDPDQALHFVGPDVGPDCLQRLSEDDKSSYACKELIGDFVNEVTRQGINHKALLKGKKQVYNQHP